MNTKATRLAYKLEEPIRLDKFLAGQIPELSRSRIQLLIQDSKVSVNDIIIKDCSYLLCYDCEVVIKTQDPILQMQPEKIEFSVLYEDDDLAIIDKPAGLITHPGEGKYTNTLANALLYHYKSNLSGCAGDVRPGIVHRLDKDTSGTILVAKNDATHMYLSDLLMKREITREYIALVYGVPIPYCGTINHNIAKHPKHRNQMCISRTDGKMAITHYKVLSVYGNNAISLIKCKLETGRTHQIRVHLTHKKHPIVGDTMYMRGLNFNINSITEADLIKNMKRQALHAASIQFIHPITQEEIRVESKIPDDIQFLMNALAVDKVNIKV